MIPQGAIFKMELMDIIVSEELAHGPSCNDLVVMTSATCDVVELVRT